MSKLRIEELFDACVEALPQAKFFYVPDHRVECGNKIACHYKYHALAGELYVENGRIRHYEGDVCAADDTEAVVKYFREFVEGVDQECEAIEIAKQQTRDRRAVRYNKLLPRGTARNGFVIVTLNFEGRTYDTQMWVEDVQIALDAIAAHMTGTVTWGAYDTGLVFVAPADSDYQYVVRNGLCCPEYPEFPSGDEDWQEQREEMIEAANSECDTRHDTIVEIRNSGYIS